MTGARCIAIEERDGSVGVTYDGGTAEPVLTIVQNDGTTARLALSVQTSRLLQNTLAEVRLEALRAARPVVELLT